MFNVNLPETIFFGINRGEYRIIRTDGTEAIIKEVPTIDAIHKAIGCDCLDTVTLDHESQTIMLVDDNGMVDGRPVNPKATEMYHRICRPRTIWSIHGDVAIVNDNDFGDDPV